MTVGEGLSKEKGGLPGTYVLALSLPRAVQLEVGALGDIPLQQGVYLYVGSARGPGGPAARLRRHARAVDRLHWHVDYLRQEAEPLLAFVSYDSQRLECAWAAALESTGVPIAAPKGFGASDCKCATHLFSAGSLACFPASVEPLRQAIGAEEVWSLRPSGALYS